MNDEILGLFYFNTWGRQKIYEKTHTWLGQTIYLSFSIIEDSHSEKCLDVLRMLCSNQDYWHNIFVDHLMKTFKEYSESEFDKNNLRLLDISIEIFNSEGDYSSALCFEFYDLTGKKGKYGAIQIFGDLDGNPNPSDWDTDWYGRGKLLDGLLSGETKPDTPITVSSVNPMPYTDE